MGVALFFLCSPVVKGSSAAKSVLVCISMYPLYPTQLLSMCNAARLLGVCMWCAGLSLAWATSMLLDIHKLRNPSSWDGLFCAGQRAA